MSEDNKIYRLAVANTQRRGDWDFHVSITNKVNVMIIARSIKGDNTMVKFFTDPEDAKGWIAEVAIGKYD